MEFQQRPRRTEPEEMKVMQPEFVKKLSRKDLARLKYVVKRRELEKINKSIKLKFQFERLKLLDVIEDGGASTKSYKQLASEISNNYKLIEQFDNPLQVYKDEKAAIQEEFKRQDEHISSFK